MDVLISKGINCDDTRECLTDAVKVKFNEKELQSIRQEIFNLAKEKALTNKDNKLVTRLRRARGLSLHDKLANDVVELIYAVRNRKPIPRVLLNNGKRALSEFSKSRDSDAATITTSEPPVHLPSNAAASITAVFSVEDDTTSSQVPDDTTSSQVPAPANTSPATSISSISRAPNSVTNSTFPLNVSTIPQNEVSERCIINDVVSSPASTGLSSKPTGSVEDSTIVHLQEEVKKLASTVETLVIKVAKVSEKPSITPSIDPCYLYARVVCQKLKDRLGKSSLEEALLCKVINYTVISDLPSMKVKIDKKDLFRALSK